MAGQYRPSGAFSVPLILLKAQVVNTVGVQKKTWQAISDGVLIFGTFKSFGGTEKTVNGIISIEDTADVETWYRPDITSGDAVVLADTGERFEIINAPENIGRRNQYLKFKVRRVEGGV